MSRGDEVEVVMDNVAELLMGAGVVAVAVIGAEGVVDDEAGFLGC